MIKMINKIPSYVYIPGAKKIDKVYTQIPTDGSGDLNFERNSIATYVDKDGLIRTVGIDEPRHNWLRLQETRTNLILRSEEFENSYWYKGYITADDNVMLAPDGNTTASELTDNTNSLTHAITKFSGWLQNIELTFSIYVKAGSKSNFYIANGSTGDSVYFDLNSGVLEGIIGTATGSIENIGDGWFRVSGTITAPLNQSLTFGFGDGYTGVFLTSTRYTGIGDVVGYIWGAQLEEGTEVTDYIKTVGITSTVLDGSPLSTCPHLLLEPASTNLVVGSAAGNYGNTPTSDTLVLAPDGTTTGVLPLVEDTSDRFQELINGGTYATNTKITYSWFSKAFSEPTGSSAVGHLGIQALVNCTVDQESVQIETYPNGWKRYRVVLNITDGALSTTVRAYFGSVVGAGNESVAYWGHQLEEGDCATSYIPTVASAVTRAAEICNGGGTVDNFNSEEGVLMVDIAALNEVVSGFREISISDGTTANRVGIRIVDSATQLQGVFRVASSAVFLGGISLNIEENNKVAVRYKLNNFSLWVNGVQIGTTDTVGGVPSANTFNTLQFDSGGGSDDFYGRVNGVYVYKEFLSDDEMSELTS